MTADDVHRHGRAIGDAKVVLAQLEVPLDAVEAAFEIGHGVGTMTVLNPAPACELTDGLLRLVDLVVPNETEAALLTGIDVAAGGTGMESAAKAADVLLTRGAAARSWSRSDGAARCTSTGRSSSMSLRSRSTRSTPPRRGTPSAARSSRRSRAGCRWPHRSSRASAAGALACTVAGASPSLPAAAAVDALLSARGPAPAGESQARIRPVARKSSRSPSS